MKVPTTSSVGVFALYARCQTVCCATIYQPVKRAPPLGISRSSSPALNAQSLAVNIAAQQTGVNAQSAMNKAVIT